MKEKGKGNSCRVRGWVMKHRAGDSHITRTVQLKQEFSQRRTVSLSVKTGRRLLAAEQRKRPGVWLQQESCFQGPNLLSAQQIRHLLSFRTQQQVFKQKKTKNNNRDIPVLLQREESRVKATSGKEGELVILNSQ